MKFGNAASTEFYYALRVDTNGEVLEVVECAGDAASEGFTTYNYKSDEWKLCGGELPNYVQRYWVSASGIWWEGELYTSSDKLTLAAAGFYSDSLGNYAEWTGTEFIGKSECSA